MSFQEWRQFIHQKALGKERGLVPRFFRWLDRATSDFTNLQAAVLWVSAGVTGLIAVLYAQAFRMVEGGFARLVGFDPLWAAGAAPFLFLAAWWLVDRWAPEAAGSGIPQILAVIEADGKPGASVFADRLLSVKVGVVKIASSLLCLAGGGAIGREGPTLQLSGIVFHFFGKHVRRYYPGSDERTWVIAGAAAGLASAFNTPLGGIVYAIEELGMKHFHKIRTALLTAVIISGLTAQSFLGSYLYLGYPRLRSVTAPEWLIVLAIGFSGGILGGLFGRLLLRGVRWRRAITTRPRLALVAIGCGVGAGVLGYLIPASHGPGGELISGILFEGRAASWAMTGARVLASALAYLSGAAGGIFAPSLAIGASFGSKLAFLFGLENLNLFAMLGMIAVLTGVTHTPFTSFILVMEMSDRHSAVFPMMLAALLAQSAAKALDEKSFYENIRDLVYLREDPREDGAGSTEHPTRER